MRRDTGIKRIRRLETCARQRQIHADLARAPWQKMASANIGKQADAGFRHGEHSALVRYPMAAMHRHADAAAHHNAMDQCDIRLWKMPYRCVQDVFITIKRQRIRRTGLPRFIKRANITACTKGPLACTTDNDRPDRLIGSPIRKLGFHGDAHRMRKRIQRLWPIQYNLPNGALSLKEHFRVVRGCHWRPSSRATITRMISFVPSRI